MKEGGCEWKRERERDRHGENERSREREWMSVSEGGRLDTGRFNQPSFQANVHQRHIDGLSGLRSSSVSNTGASSLLFSSLARLASTRLSSHGLYLRGALIGQRVGQMLAPEGGKRRMEKRWNGQVCGDEWERQASV